MCVQRTENLLQSSPYVREMEIAELLNGLNVEAPPPSPSLPSTDNPDPDEGIDESDIEDGSTTESGPASPNPYELWSEQTQEGEEEWTRQQEGCAEERSGTRTVTPMPETSSQENTHPPPYTDFADFYGNPFLSGTTFETPAGSGFNATNTGLNSFDGSLFNFGFFGGSPTTGGGYFPTPPPYTPLPETQDFGLKYYPQGFFGMTGGTTQNREFDLLGFNPPATPPPAYEPATLPLPPMPYGFDWQYLSMQPSLLGPYFPPPPPSYYPMPMGGPLASGMFLRPPPPPPPIVPNMMMPPIPPFPGSFPPFPNRFQGHHAPRPQCGRFQPGGLHRAPGRFQPPPHPMGMFSTPMAQIRRPVPLNPYSATFFPKTLDFSNESISLTSTSGSNCSTGEAGSLTTGQSLLGEAPSPYRLDPPKGPPQKPISIFGDEDLPYVCNVWDIKVMASMKPAPTNFAYYVPPRVDDNDFFGGQIRIWQERMMTCFQYFSPDIWILQGLSDFTKQNEQGWAHFTITCKLRFCCRNCLRPWTSMRGKIHFAFQLNTSLRRGLILMKIFGQVCNHEKCGDHRFQTPACYPEEIERVLWKLSEYVGFIHYKIPLSPKFYNEPDKAIRVGNPRSPHRPALCQACQQGMCSKMP